jgi:hypothetical protein
MWNAKIPRMRIIITEDKKNGKDSRLSAEPGAVDLYLVFKNPAVMHGCKLLIQKYNFFGLAL